MEPIQIDISKDPRRIDLQGPILVAHQPEFLPWLGNISKATMGDIYLFFDTDQFKKETFQNRNRIRVKNQEGFQWLIIPVKDAKTRMMRENEVQMHDNNWKQKHLRSIKHSYSKATFFDKYFSSIERLYSYENNDLAGFLIKIVAFALKEFKINVPVYRTSELIKQGFLFEGKSTDIIISMCKAFNAKTFVAGVTGKTYLDKKAFETEKIQLVFQNFEHPVYNQLHGEFVPNMSFIDLLFNQGPESIKILRKSNYHLG